MKNFKSPVSRLARDTPFEERGLVQKKNFIRKTEDFVCENCGERVVGDGYTDHCPKCLFGKHVDEEIPGDRASECRGLMEPIKSTYKSGYFRIYYKCSRCRHEFWVKAAEDDKNELLIKLTSNF